MVNVDDMWALDDFQRRIMQNLFSDRVTLEEIGRRREKRGALVLFLEGVDADNADRLSFASRRLIELAHHCPAEGNDLPTPTPDYGQHRDQVSE